MNYLLVGSMMFCFIIGVILTASIPGAYLENIKNNENQKYTPYDIKSMEISSYVFYAIGGILVLYYIISSFIK